MADTVAMMILSVAGWQRRVEMRRGDEAAKNRIHYIIVVIVHHRQTKHIVSGDDDDDENTLEKPVKGKIRQIKVELSEKPSFHS